MMFLFAGGTTDVETVKRRMSAYMEVRLKQRAVIEFLTEEGIVPIDIHRRMSAVYGKACVDISTVRRWVRGSWMEKPGTSSVHNKSGDNCGVGENGFNGCFVSPTL